MALSAKYILKPISMATNTCLTSLPSLFKASKASHSSLSIPFKPIRLQISCSYATSIPLSLKKNKPVTRVCVIEDDSPVLVEEQEGGEFSWADAPESDGGGDAETDGFAELLEEAKLYVGNFPYDVDSPKLAQIFEAAGTVEVVEIICNRETEQSRGFGFVTMSTVEEAEKAVEMFHKYELNGRFLTVNKASKRGSKPPARVPEPRYRIYVGNLPWGVDDARLEQMFSEYGKVVSARVLTDRETRKSRGFGFVVMSSEAEMNDAITNLDGQNVDGRSIRANVAADRPDRPARGGF